MIHLVVAFAFESQMECAISSRTPEHKKNVVIPMQLETILIFLTYRIVIVYVEL